MIADTPAQSLRLIRLAVIEHLYEMLAAMQGVKPYRETAGRTRFIQAAPTPTPSPLSTPPGNHARDARAIASGRLGAGEELPAPIGPRSTPATLTRAYCCGQEVHHNETLGISFCDKCGYRGRFLFRTLGPFQTSLGGA